MSAALAKTLQESGITRLLLVRHANAAPPGSKAKVEYEKIHDWQKDDQVVLQNSFPVSLKSRFVADAPVAAFLRLTQVPISRRCAH